MNRLRHWKECGDYPNCLIAMIGVDSYKLVCEKTQLSVEDFLNKSSRYGDSNILADALAAEFLGY